MYNVEMITRRNIIELFRKIRYRSIFVYLLLLIPSYILFALAWYKWIDGSLYYCSDRVPFLDFQPPFNHGSLSGDYWIASKDTVYSVWYLFLLGIVTVPALILGFVSKKKKMVGFTVSVVILGVMVFIANEFKHATSAPPEPPPSLTNPNAKYRIAKLGENFAISYQEGDKEEQIIYVGNTRVRLGECVNCYVRIDGFYPLYEESGLCQDTNTQCIAGKCHKIFKSRGQQKLSTCAVDIQSVEVLPTDENLEAIPGDYLDVDQSYYYLPGMRFRVGKELVKQRLTSMTRTLLDPGLMWSTNFSTEELADMTPDCRLTQGSAMGTLKDILGQYEDYLRESAGWTPPPLLKQFPDHFVIYDIGGYKCTYRSSQEAQTLHFRAVGELEKSLTTIEEWEPGAANPDEEEILVTPDEK